MLRIVGPLLVFGAALFVWWQNTDGDAQFWLLPYVETLPWVGDSFESRADATLQILLGMGTAYAAVEAWLWLRAWARRRRDEKAMDDAEKLRDWAEQNPWRDV